MTHTVRGVPVQEVDTGDVRVGDRVACWLSDASAYVRVTGWSDRVLTLSRFGLADVTHRTFTASGAPWWVNADSGIGVSMLTFSLPGRVSIVAREG